MTRAIICCQPSAEPTSVSKNLNNLCTPLAFQSSTISKETSTDLLSIGLSGRARMGVAVGVVLRTAGTNKSLKRGYLRRTALNRQMRSGIMGTLLVMNFLVTIQRQRRKRAIIMTSTIDKIPKILITSLR